MISLKSLDIYDEYDFTYKLLKYLISVLVIYDKSKNIKKKS
jgi:hypothetical protein